MKKIATLFLALLAMSLFTVSVFAETSDEWITTRELNDAVCEMYPGFVNIEIHLNDDGTLRIEVEREMMRLNYTYASPEQWKLTEEGLRIHNAVVDQLITNKEENANNPYAFVIEQFALHFITLDEVAQRFNEAAIINEKLYAELLFITSKQAVLLLKNEDGLMRFMTTVDIYDWTVLDKKMLVHPDVVDALLEKSYK